MKSNSVNVSVRDIDVMHASQSLYREHYTVLIHLRDLIKKQSLLSAEMVTACMYAYV